MSLHRRWFLLAAIGAAAAPGAASSQSEPVHRIVIRSNLGCGCCVLWERHLQESGRFRTRLIEDIALQDYKRRVGVPTRLMACHTAEVQGYVIEGHVPSREILRLIAERPAGVRGLAVAGMPVGSPGMENGTMRDAYDVIAFHEDGSQSVFASYEMAL